MAKLGRGERKFCRHHQIPESRLFDASGLKPADYREIMKSEEKWAAFGVNKCKPRGHVLRNRQGDCLMCNLQAVAHLLRTKMSGYLYVAEGGGGRFMKLGFSNNPANRIGIANYEGWGGYGDWRLVAYGWAHEAGRLEGEFLAAFADSRVTLDWKRNWQPTTTRESFRIDLIGAIEKLVWLCDGPPEIVPPGA